MLLRPPPRPTRHAHQPPDRPLETYQRILSALLAPVTTTGIVLLLVIFVLLERESIRDRFIRLAGGGDIERTTAALDDAATRLSRYLSTLTAINVGYGVVVAVGLWAIGVPNPLIWGTVTTVMRFVPFVGALLAAIFPVLLAAAVDPGWTMVAWTVALFVVVDIAVGQFIEPLAQGQSTGLSPLAVVVDTIFWGTLWGPVGLLLATPLTMCLVVLGRHFDGFVFLDIALGDEPALSPAEVLYQRLPSG
jgi:predicted PurR-regulated permease PerM